MIAPLDKFANQLDWNLLRTFMVIVQERSITLAAHRLSVTQPSVSAALRRLEDRLERRLIERGGNEVFRATAAGEVLYRHCSDIYGVITALPHELDAARVTVQGIVTLHMSGHIHWPELTGMIAEYRREYPLVRFRLRRQTCDEILSGVAQKSLTLGIVSEVDARPVLKRRQLFDMEMAFYASTEAPPAERQHAPQLGFEGEHVGGPLEFLPIHRVKSGFEGITVAEAPDCASLAGMIRAGLGVGLLPCSFADREPGLSKLPADALRMPVYMVRHEQVSLGPAEQGFLHYLESRPV